ncbi:PVC-type heme-binding CxxCH protein [Aureliella helgolandensis]|uniref:Cytochrome c n=1 Tax=Aureliella helgolandensis TaxID=2527968 RepID=A0A518G6R9_9BACT|nr:PVC-type heme-binding CxxCH protein [Aureliella helgolandensis]QDV24275.1 Cytochrome c [Aureliella helgolandensis]
MFPILRLFEFTRRLSNLARFSARLRSTCPASQDFQTNLAGPLGRRRPPAQLIFDRPAAQVATLLLAASTVVGGVDFLRADEAKFQGAAEPSTQAQDFGEGVRESDWQTPAQEQASFHLPPGFEINLFAAEMDIAKPLNMAWDPQGRLWITSTVEYPYPVRDGREPRDQILILEDTNQDGQADKTTVFADKLNIPMGLLPVPGGVICFDIPNLYLLRDTDGDGRADDRKLILGPFDTTRDTHGMINALRRGEDGWIYACHGFNNHSQVTAADGSSIKLMSGNTFRFREDGSRVEQYTSGQVNPFGMTSDEWGNWYTADCHSKPLTALLPGACYESFGRPHDGMGFAPDMMQHLHGSTAISGLMYYQGTAFPPAYRQRFYSGNVMTSRINANELVWQGATATARELPDFLTCDDPWFRPVDIQMGPDGALYVADFYNKIIGHYEVPLTHPGRDRDSGRIWRISYAQNQPATVPPLATATRLSDIDVQLTSVNPMRRRAAVETWLQASSNDAGSEELNRLFAGNWEASLRSTLEDRQGAQLKRISGLEILWRSGRLSAEQLVALLEQQLQSDSGASAFLTARLLHLTTELPRNQKRIAVLPRIQTVARALLLQANTPHLQRAAALSLGSTSQHPEDVLRLLELASQVRVSDPALSHTARLAARNLLSRPAIVRTLSDQLLGDESTVSQPPHQSATMLSEFVGILPGLASGEAAKTLLQYAISPRNTDSAITQQALDLGLQHITTINLADLLAAIDRLSSTSHLEPDQHLEQAKLFGQLSAVYLQHGHATLPDELDAYLDALLNQLCGELSESLQANGPSLAWLGSPTWPPQERPAADGQLSPLRSSFVLGEAYTGAIRTEPFACPSVLEFWIAGHNGTPSEPDQKLNRVRLRQAGTEEILMQAFPPRSDTAQKTTWDLTPWAGSEVYVELVDQDAAGAFAWIAVGRFSEPSLEFSSTTQQVAAINQLFELGQYTDAQSKSARAWPPRLLQLELGEQQRVQLMGAMLVGAKLPLPAKLAKQALALGRTDLIQSSLLDSAGVGQDALLQLARELYASAAGPEQKKLTEAFLVSVEGCELLVTLANQGAIHAGSFRGQAGLLPAKLAQQDRDALEQLIAAAEKTSTDEDLAAKRLATIDWSQADTAVGKQLFTQHCAICHQLGGEGKLIGPQLDGAVVRGRDRLAEDILEPNRNVDVAFRLTSLLLESDTVMSGLVKERADGRLDVTRQDGQIVTLTVEEVAERRDTDKSLMPANMADILSDAQLASLLRYLTEFKPH